MISAADRRADVLQREFLSLIEFMVESGNYSAEEAQTACAAAGIPESVSHRVIVQSLNASGIDALADAARRVA